MNDSKNNNRQETTILCIEDDKDTCELLSILFPEYKLIFAHTFNEAVSLLEKQQFDLVITDNWLPDGSGIELCRKIRAGNERIPIIFTSGAGQQSEIQNALDAGAQKYLVKPYEPENLQQIVKELIENHS